MNHPKAKTLLEPKIIPLNFVDHTEYTKPKLTGTRLDTVGLIEALTFVIHGIAKNDTRPVLACVLFDSGNNILKLVAADGFRMPITQITADGIPEEKILIYRSDIQQLLAFLKSNVSGKGKHKEWLDTYISTTNNTVKFMSDKGIVEFDKQPGTYPDYQHLIPTNGTKVEFIASNMLEAVNTVSHIAKDGSDIVRLQFNTGEPCGKITITAKSEQCGESSVECDALVESDCKIAVNCNYLMDLLRQCKDSRITIRLTNPSSPMDFAISDSKQETMMPMFVQW